jgi:S-methylmethionine-dependent homocysteine/selenocysteine methylase
LLTLGDDIFMTDGGIETTLIFHDGLDLPQFAAFDLLKDDAGTDALRRYFSTYADLAAEHNIGLVLESPTWRASPDWGAAVGYGLEALADANRRAIDLMREIREAADVPIVISGCIGPQGDGYDPAEMLSPGRAMEYHLMQAETFAAAGADLVTAITMTYTDEAVGVTRAAAKAGLPAVISFTTETDGRLPSGQLLGDAITEVDTVTDGGPAYYMINCAHPSHFEGALAAGGEWCERSRGVRPNASMMSHAELDDAAELDEGDPRDLGRRVAELRECLPNLTVIGGCCGTDDRHVDQMFQALTSAA